VASEIAQALFTNNPELIYEAFLRVPKKGSPYAYQVLADRAFGKLKEVHQVEHTRFSDASNEQIEQQIAELQGKLIEHLREQGYTVTAPPQLLPPADDSKPN
jgi:hypothetical protein